MGTEGKVYGIGEVQGILKKEFPDVTISKIRFLEKEGLITPDRTSSGYRKYGRTHIKQLSYILRLQREEYLPLSVIKRKIQDLKSGKVVAGDLALMSGPAAEQALTGAVPVSLDLAPAKLGLDKATLQEMIEYGIVGIHEGPEGKYFGPEDMKILTVAKEFLRFGVEPRHLRMFSQFVTRESSFIEQIIKPQLQHKDPNTKRSAIKDMENLIHLSQVFVQALLNQSLSKYLPRPAPLDIEEDISAGEPQQREGEGVATVKPDVITGDEMPEDEKYTDPEGGGPDEEMFPG